MASNKWPGPDPPFQKKDGRWTFYYYPEGVRTEVGEYASEDEAKAAFIKVQRIWISNGGAYGPINAVIN